MAWRHPDPGDLKFQIVNRVTEGETISAICAEPGMPRRRTVATWAREDGGFGAMLAEARRKGRFRRVLTYDPARGREILLRLGAGETIASVLRDPRMPGRKVFERWKLAEASFGEELWRLRRGHYHRLALISRHRALPWDPALGDRLLVRLHRGERLREAVKAEPAFDRAVRTLQLAWARKRRRVRRCTPQFTERVARRIAGGASLWSLSKEPGMPSPGTFYRWMRTLPDFAAAVDAACDLRRAGYVERVRDLLDDLTPENAAGRPRHRRPHRPRRPAGGAPRQGAPGAAIAGRRPHPRAA